MAVPHGNEAKLFVDASSDFSSTNLSAASWTEVALAEDLDPPGTRESSERHPRGMSPFRATVPGQIDLTTSATILFDPTDSQVSGLRDAFQDGTIVAVAVVHLNPGGTPTSEGWTFLAHVTEFNQSMPMGDAQTVDVTFVPAVVAADDKPVYDSDFSTGA